MIRIYNSLSRKKEEFLPLKEREVKMYACGVTPYDDIHVGHAMQAVVYDVIRAYLEYRGYHVVYVRNFTDVDDKIINRANRESKKASEISEHFIKENSNDLKALKVCKADFEPKVTDCIGDIIEYIQVLIEKGFAYVSSGEVFFDIDKFPGYGKLSNRKREDLINSEVSPNKRNSNDFVLWKPFKPGEPAWDSRWGKGRPGWHIECSVMANKFLGEKIDIHGGGLDLIFPHHENELAQSEAYSGKEFAKYWLHNGLVMIDGVKMSKSLGNFLTVKDALKQYLPDEIRYAILTHQYSSNVDFSKELFLNARKRLYYFYATLKKADALLKSEEIESRTQIPEIIENMNDEFMKYMDDNFSTPQAISYFGDVFKELNKTIESSAISIGEKKYILGNFMSRFKDMSSILRLFDEDPSAYLGELNERLLGENGLTAGFIEEKLSERQAAKEKKNFGEADRIKEELKSKNVGILDTKEGAKWEFLF